MTGFSSVTHAAPRWRYRAIAMDGGSGERRGEASGATAAEVRASLRRIGLQVVEIKAVRSRALRHSGERERDLIRQGLGTLNARINRHLCRRRQPVKAELFDSLATLLESGLPLLEAMQSTGHDRPAGWGRWRGPGARQAMLADLRDQLRGGASLGAAMERHPGWFDPVEYAMVHAAQHAGTLPAVLRNLSDRLERSGELSSKLAGALAYPMVVTMVGLGVTVFLSVKTLPDLTAILASLKLESPALTRNVMMIGQMIAGWWWAVFLALLLIAISWAAAQRLLQYRGFTVQRLRWLHPLVLRRLALAKFCGQLAELLRSGVPMTEALRVLAPTMGRSDLSTKVREAAVRLERGEDLAHALDDPHWFDPEFRRLLEVGQAGGELDQLLACIAERYARQSRRLIDRLAALLEPTVILILAALVGLVVMAAVLPLLKLQEVL